jgi:hypothetical protein
MTNFKLPPLRAHDRCDDTVPATITVDGFIRAFQTSVIKIDANESVTIVRLYEGIVYLAQTRGHDIWVLGSMPLLDFLHALENSGSTKIPGKMRYILQKAMTYTYQVHSEEMATCMGWDGNCP